MKYKLLKNSLGEDNSVICFLDDSYISIPFDPANTDYQAYLAWLNEGNEPLPADEN